MCVCLLKTGGPLHVKCMRLEFASCSYRCVSDAMAVSPEGCSQDSLQTPSWFKVGRRRSLDTGLHPVQFTKKGDLAATPPPIMSLAEP